MSGRDTSENLEDTADDDYRDLHGPSSTDYLPDDMDDDEVDAGFLS